MEPRGRMAMHRGIRLQDERADLKLGILVPQPPPCLHAGRTLWDHNGQSDVVAAHIHAVPLLRGNVCMSVLRHYTSSSVITNDLTSRKKTTLSGERKMRGQQ